MGAVAATVLLIAMPLLPFAMPKRVAEVAAIWGMLACSLGGLACLVGY